MQCKYKSNLFWGFSMCETACLHLTISISPPIVPPHVSMVTARVTAAAPSVKLSFNFRFSVQRIALWHKGAISLSSLSVATVIRSHQRRSLRLHEKLEDSQRAATDSYEARFLSSAVSDMISFTPSRSYILKRHGNSNAAHVACRREVVSIFRRLYNDVVSACTTPDCGWLINFAANS